MKQFSSCLILIMFMSIGSVSFTGFASEVEQPQSQEGLSQCCCAEVLQAISSAIDRLGTPTGATAVAATYGVLQGISNFVWAFDWERRVGLSEEISSTIQEIGGLCAAGECIIMGALIPIMLFLHNKQQPDVGDVHASDDS